MKWEYRVVMFDIMVGSTTEVALKALGHEGWELVAVTLDRYEGERCYEAIFKRPLATPPPL